MHKYIRTSLFAVAALSLATTLYAEGVGIAETEITPDPSAMLEVASTNKGALFPRMTTAQREAIASPAVGLMVFDTDQDTFYFNNTNGWAVLGATVPTETPVIAFHISSPNGTIGVAGGSQPLVLTRTNSINDFVESGCVTISTNFPAFSGKTVACFEAPFDGIYSFQANCLLLGNGGSARLQLWKNSSLVGQAYFRQSQGWYPLHFSTTLRLNTGDKVMPGMDSGGGLSIFYSAEYTSFSGFLVSPL